MAGLIDTVRRQWTARFAKPRVLPEVGLGKLSSDTILFYSSVGIDEIWTRTTALACRAAGLPVAVAIAGSQHGVEALVAPYRLSGIAVYRLAGTSALRNTDVRIVVTASSGVARALFSDRLVHLIHMPHSLISLHMAYPPEAFDGYDLLFAAGPHHAAEFAAIRKVRGGHGSAQPVGYGKLDLLTQGLQSHPHRDGPRHVLVAPSWGPANLLNVLGQDLVTSLLGRGYRLTLRPHPSFLDGEPELVATLCAAGAASPLFEFENPSTENRAIYDADVLVSDYSGAALEFAALRRRPTVFVDVAKKVFNPDWESLGLPVAEVEHRSALGVIVQADLKMIAEGIDRIGRDADEFVRSITHAEQIFCFRPEHCGRKAASLIGELA